MHRIFPFSFSISSSSSSSSSDAQTFSLPVETTFVETPGSGSPKSVDAPQELSLMERSLIISFLSVS